jgi:hypothetical protein
MIPSDKIIHFCAGFLLSITGLYLYPFCILGFLAGIAKEAFDVRMGGWADINDVVATWGGASLATAIVVMRSIHGHP